MTAEQLFHDIAKDLKATEGKMFGALCLKVPSGKAAVIYWCDKTPKKTPFMIFKLDEKNTAAAIKLKGAKVFEPAAGRPMNGWVQLDFEHADKFKDFSKKALSFVKSLE